MDQVLDVCVGTAVFVGMVALPVRMFVVVVAVEVTNRIRMVVRVEGMFREESVEFYAGDTASVFPFGLENNFFGEMEFLEFDF